MFINGIWHPLLEEIDGEGNDLPGDSGDSGSTDGNAAGGDGSADDGRGGGESEGQTKPDGDGYWPGDWREKLSADGKHNKTLERFASPGAVFESYLALRQKLDSGEYKSAATYPDKGTDEEKTAWRKANGIPEKASDYTTAFEDGLTISEEDQPVVDGFLEAAHSINATPGQVNALLGWYYKNQEEMVDKRAEADTQVLSASEDALRAEWGNDYRANVNMMKGLVDTVPESVRDMFLNARLSDGTPVFSHPDMAQWFVHAARTINPVASVVPGAGANAASAIEDEIDQIEGTMRTDRQKYNKDTKMQERLRELYSARERAKA